MASGGARSVVLVVDDDASIRLLCRVNLELAGYDVREAGTLAEARTLLDGVSVALLDMHIGSEPGAALVDELRARGIAVAVVTGSADLSSAAAGADAVLGKPFEIEDLEATVARLAGRDR